MRSISVHAGLHFQRSWVEFPSILAPNYGHEILQSTSWYKYPWLILGLRPANRRRSYKVTPSLIDWVQKFCNVVSLWLGANLESALYTRSIWREHSLCHPTCQIQRPYLFRSSWRYIHFQRRKHTWEDLVFLCWQCLFDRMETFVSFLSVTYASIGYFNQYVVGSPGISPLGFEQSADIPSWYINCVQIRVKLFMG